MNIYIPIEIKARELEGRVLLALVAAERGHTVIVGEKRDTISLATSGVLPPGLVHMKSITPHDSMLGTLDSLIAGNHAITVQDEEGGLLDENYDTFARLRFGESTLSRVDRVCTWGNYDARSLRKIYPEAVSKFTVTGSPRVDFWRKDFAGYYQNSEDAITLNGKPYIMVVANFSGPLNENRFYNVMARLNKAGYFSREEGRERHEFDNAAYQTRLIGEFVFMIRELAKTWSNYNILVRPHPVESIEGWQKLIGDIPGVYVQREGTISRWIRHSKVIIHNGCTSAMEAAIAGDNRIAYRPIPHEIEREIPNKVSIQAFSMDELKNQIEALLNGQPLHQESPDYPRIEELLNDRFAAIHGKLAADRVVDVWDEIAKMKGLRNTSVDELKSRHRTPPVPIIRKLKSSIISSVNSITGRSSEKKSKKLLKSSFKFPDFTDEEFEVILHSLRRNLNRFDQVRYLRNGKKSFILY